eukprot:scaffold48_cov311-Pinguiococcus_pyrenoidosus.AAC.143
MTYLSASGICGICATESAMKSFSFVVLSLWALFGFSCSSTPRSGPPRPPFRLPWRPIFANCALASTLLVFPTAPPSLRAPAAIAAEYRIMEVKDDAEETKAIARAEAAYAEGKWEGTHSASLGVSAGY